MASYVRERNLVVYSLAKILSSFLFRPVFKLQIMGQNNVPAKGPLLVLPKHQRWEDIPLLALAMERPLYYIAKYELFRNPISGAILSSLGGVPIDRLNPTKSIRSLKTVFDLLKRDEGIVIFPEGTYYINQMGKCHKGLIRMVLARQNASLLPVGINYSKEGKSTQVRINIGRPFYKESSTDMIESLDLVFQEIARLSELNKK
jgi:1-acyl-sn-glycerol-3-phosphate acyltransferase